jgi:hypothetical protein
LKIPEYEAILKGNPVSDVEPIGEFGIDEVLHAIFTCPALGVIDVVLII